MSHCHSRQINKTARTRACLPIALLLFAPIAGAGVYEVDDTGTAGGLEFESKFFMERYSNERTWTLPELSMNNRLADNVELSLGAVYGTLHPHRGPSQGAMQAYMAAVKWRFVDHTAEGGVAIAIEPTAIFPGSHASRGISDGATGFALPLRIAKRHGRVQVTGQVGVERLFGQDADAVDAGILTEYILSDQWSYGIEFVADAPANDMGAYHLRSNVGFAWAPNDHFGLQMLVGRSLDNRRGGPVTHFGMLLQYAL